MYVTIRRSSHRFRAIVYVCQFTFQMECCAMRSVIDTQILIKQTTIGVYNQPVPTPELLSTGCRTQCFM